MEVLRDLLGILSSGLIRLLSAVGSIAAVSIFLLKPTFDSRAGLIAAPVTFTRTPRA